MNLQSESALGATLVNTGNVGHETMSSRVQECGSSVSLARTSQHRVNEINVCRHCPHTLISLTSLTAINCIDKGVSFCSDSGRQIRHMPSILERRSLLLAGHMDPPNFPGRGNQAFHLRAQHRATSACHRHANGAVHVIYFNVCLHWRQTLK